MRGLAQRKQSHVLGKSPALIAELREHRQICEGPEQVTYSLLWAAATTSLTEGGREVNEETRG